ncbi:MAG: isocitrate lyase/phosphoenolpyruvate mutase family protein [Nitrospinae bacterium]|nr:isocitrate lyase/phosphoenolpyruvate mutase family protein [Nitrospinota bacterium]
MSGKVLHNLLEKEKFLVMPGAYNAFTAKQIALAGFPGVYVSGAAVANSLGVPDDGTLGLEDFLYMGGWIAKAVGVPVICDADTGFQDINETVRKYIGAGFSGMHIEDQVFPKKCGHLPGKKVIARNEMAAKIREACKVRDELDPKFIIIARTDARGASNIEDKDQLEECITRGKSFLDAGAQMIFADALRSRDEFARYREEVPGYLLASMSEFGKTPFIKTQEFREWGYNILIFPVSLFRYHAGKTNEFLARLKSDGNQERLVSEMMSREEINEYLDYREKVESF